MTTKKTRNPSLQQKRKRERGRALLLLEGCKIQKLFCVLCFVLCFLSIPKTMYLDGFGFWRSGLCLYILNGAVHHESSKTEQTKLDLRNAYARHIFYTSIFMFILRRMGLNSGLGAVSGSLIGSLWLMICPGSRSRFCTTEGDERSISLAILLKKLFT